MRLHLLPGYVTAEILIFLSKNLLPSQDCYEQPEHDSEDFIVRRSQTLISRYYWTAVARTPLSRTMNAVTTIYGDRRNPRSQLINRSPYHLGDALNPYLIVDIRATRGSKL